MKSLRKLFLRRAASPYWVRILKLGGNCWSQLKLSPTLSEFQRMAYDISQHVLNQQQLKLSLFGWLESVDKAQLDDQKLQPHFDQVIKAILSSKNVAEEIEISSVSTVSPEKP